MENEVFLEWTDYTRTQEQLPLLFSYFVEYKNVRMPQVVFHIFQHSSNAEYEIYIEIPDHPGTCSS